MPNTPHARSARAFSLLELTLVLVIIGIMMAGAALFLTGFGQRARIKTTITRIAVVQQAIDAYNLNKSNYPPDLQTLVTGKYLDPSRPLTDSWDRDIRYTVPGSDGHSYDLWSQGENPDDESDDLDVWTMHQRRD